MSGDGALLSESVRYQVFVLGSGASNEGGDSVYGGGVFCSEGVEELFFCA